MTDEPSWGSAQAMTWVWDLDVRPPEKLVALVLADACSDPSNIDFLSAKTGMEAEHVKKALQGLQRRGHLAELMTNRWGGER